MTAKGRGCLFIVLGALGAAACCCCLGSALILAAGDGSTRWDPVQLLVDEVPLGDAEIPANRPVGGERRYRWLDTPSRYSLGYGLDGAVHDEVQQAHQVLAKRFKYVAGEPFWWTPPRGCTQRPWECIFDEVATANSAKVAPLAELFERRRAQATLDARELTEVVVTFIQQIPYRLPTEAPFGLLPPAIVAADGSGDCDSKSLLAAMILEDLGIDCVILYSQKLGHAALGVALPGTGQSFREGGTKYLYVEMTVPGWAIGTVPPEFNHPKLWEPIPFARH